MSRITHRALGLVSKVLPSKVGQAACAPNESWYYYCGTGRKEYLKYCYTKTLSGGTCQRVCTTTWTGQYC